MSPGVQQRVVAFSVFITGLFGLGGCPQLAPPTDDVAIAPEPGRYYVEQFDGKLSYYRLSEWRGDESGWVELDDEGTWYTGPGFYVLSDDYVWSRDEDTEGMTLDDAIQLHDPPPAPIGTQ
jgi:hypothetical protein